MSKIVTVVLVGVIAIAVGVLFLPERLNEDFTVPLPLPLFIGSAILASTLRKLADALTPAPFRVLDDMTGMYKSAVVNSLVYHRIPDLVQKKGSISVEEISQIIGADDSKFVLRWLRAAESLGYLHEDEKTGLWTQSRFSDVLRSDHPNTLVNMASHIEADYTPSFVDFKNTILKSKEIAFVKNNNGVGFWEHLQSDPKLVLNFAGAMSNMDSFSWYTLTHDFDWGQYARVVDYGGSRGHFLARLLQTYPNLTGVLFDRPEVVSAAPELWRAQFPDARARLSVVGGSFFEVESLPEFKDGDVVELRFILHDWSDEQALRILKVLRARIGAKRVHVAVIDVCLGVRDPVPARYLLDLVMMTILAGKERYRADFELLFAQAGFRLDKVVSTRALASVVVGIPVN